MIRQEDIERELEQHHRDAMLDLVLAWGSLDGALGMMLSRGLSIPMAEGAALIGKMAGSKRFAEMRKLMLRAIDGAQAAAKLKKYKNDYERYSKARNFIAHSHCAGVWRKDRDYIVFATFEKFGVDELAIDAVPIDEMKRDYLGPRNGAGRD